jgi:hypothetical protein
MKRVLLVLVGVSMACSFGCFQAYDVRLNYSLENRKYLKSLDKNTEPPESASKLKPAKVYLRAPKGFKLAQTFVMGPVEPNKFDVSESFIDTSKQASLHILARSTFTPKPATKKGANPSAEPAAARGDFTTDVIDLVKSAYSVDLDAAQLKSVQPDAYGGKKQTYRSATLDADGKQIKVYFHGAKGEPAQVAFVFEGPKEALGGITKQIDYSLNSLAVGSAADSRYNNGDGLSGEETAAPPVF